MKTAVLLLLACALLALGWLFFWPTQIEGLMPTEQTPSSEDVSPTPTSAADIPREQAQPTSSADEDASQKQDDAFLVRLVNGDTGEVIPNHELWYASTILREAGDREASIKSRGKKVQCDATGIARIEKPPRQIILYARKDHLVGSQWLDRKSYRESEQPFATLELFPERVITIRVINASGMPAAGVWLKCTLLNEAAQTTKWGWSQATDEGGQFIWKDFALVLHRAQQDDIGTITGLRIQALVPGHDPVTLDVSPLPNHGQSFDLRIKPTGSLTVRVFDPSGELVIGKHSIELRLLEQNEETGEWDRGEPHGLTLAKGVGTLSEIALDGYFELSVQGIWMPKHRIEIFGPTSEDRSVTRDIPIENSRIIWRGRAVDGFGHGLGGVRLKCELRAGKEWISYFADTDSDGRFLSILPEKFADRELSKAQIELRHHTPIDMLSRSPFTKGVTDIGEIVFEDQVALLSGKVIAPPNADCTSYGFRVEQRLPGTETWRELDTKTERQGDNFTIMGPLGVGELRLRITSWERCYVPPEPIPFVPGQEGLTIQLEVGHRLVVHAQMSTTAESMSAVPLTFLLRPVSGPAKKRLPAKESQGILGRWSREGTQTLLEIDWQSLIPGTYELEVRFADVLPALRTLREIQIPNPDDQTIHLDLDLSEELQEFHLHLSTHDGVAPAGWSQAYLVRGDERIVRAIASCKPGENEISVIAPPKAFDIWVLATGYRPVYLRALDRDQNVILTASRIDLTVRRRDTAALPDGVGLMIHIESQVDVLPNWQRATGGSQLGLVWDVFFSANGHRDRNWPKSVSAAFDSSGVAKLTIHRAGSQAVRVELVPTNTERRASWRKEKIWIDGVAPARFEAGTTGEAQTLQISIPATAIEAALQKAGMR